MDDHTAIIACDVDLMVASALRLYIAFDILLDIFGDIVPDHPPHPLRQWLRHTASVPKGFLRCYALQLLRQKPMSGSEIMDTIEKGTDGRWKPSPGSVYPLLAWLQENEYTEEIPTEESGTKRYRLTEKGEKLFEKHVKFREKLQKKLEVIAPPIFSAFLISAHPEKLRKIQEPERRFVRALFNLRKTLENNFTEQTIEKIAEFLNTTSEAIEELCTIIERR